MRLFHCNIFQGADGRNVLLTEEIEAIRTGLQQLNTNQNLTSKEICIPQVESVPEELFRRYIYILIVGVVFSFYLLIFGCSTIFIN